MSVDLDALTDDERDTYFQFVNTITGRAHTAQDWLTAQSILALGIEVGKRQAMEGRDALKSDIEALIAESDGVAGLHYDDEVASWDWLIENVWLSSLAEPAPGDAAPAVGTAAHAGWRGDGEAP